MTQDVRYIDSVVSNDTNVGWGCIGEVDSDQVVLLIRGNDY